MPSESLDCCLQGARSAVIEFGPVSPSLSLNFVQVVGDLDLDEPEIPRYRRPE